MRKLEIIESDSRHFEVEILRGRKLRKGRWKWRVTIKVADGAPLTLAEARAVMLKAASNLEAQGCNVTTIDYMADED